jgi:hypothetical protein
MRPSARWVASSIESEFATASLGDERRKRRLQLVAKRAMENPAKGLPQIVANDAELEGVYRLLNNESVTPEAVLQPHIEATLGRARETGTCLVVHDTTSFEFRGESPRKGLGLTAGKAQGFQTHLALAPPSGLPAAPAAHAGPSLMPCAHRLHPPQKSAELEASAIEEKSWIRADGWARPWERRPLPHPWQVRIRRGRLDPLELPVGENAHDPINGQVAEQAEGETVPSHPSQAVVAVGVVRRELETALECLPRSSRRSLHLLLLTTKVGLTEPQPVLRIFRFDLERAVEHGNARVPILALVEPLGLLAERSGGMRLGSGDTRDVEHAEDRARRRTLALQKRAARFLVCKRKVIGSFSPPK